MGQPSLNAQAVERQLGWGHYLSPPGPETLHKDSLPLILWGSINVPNKNGNLISLISSEGEGHFHPREISRLVGLSGAKYHTGRGWQLKA